MQRKNAIIIGAGIAGLSAGCYLQRNGYETSIFEMSPFSGGLCHSWKRDGYTFDACIQSLIGSSPASSYNQIWKELGAIEDAKIIDFDIYKTIILPDGRKFEVSSDAEKLRVQMLTISPEDKQHIDNFIDSVIELSKYNIPINKPFQLFNVFDYLGTTIKHYGFLKMYNVWTEQSVRDFTELFKSSSLKKFVLNLAEDERYSMMYVIGIFAARNVKSAGFPLGGSSKLIKNIEDNYGSLGGEINYGKIVTRIIVENNIAKGIEMEDGTIHKADIVVSAADGFSTIFHMLDGKFVNDEIKLNYERLPLYNSRMQISLGVDMEFPIDTPCISFPIDGPIVTDPKTKINDIELKITNYDTSLAPKGKTSLIVFLNTEYKYWEDLMLNKPEKYSEEKERIKMAVISELDKKFKGLREKVEVTDVATPMTYFKDTNNWRGSWAGWLPTPKSYTLRMNRTLPELKNFYMTGQWVVPGALLPVVALASRQLVQLICNEDNNPFISG